MKKILYLFIACFITLSAFAQSTEIKLSEKVKVTFPAQPSTQTMPTGPVIYTLFSKDSSIVNMAVVVDLAAMGLTADVITAMGDGIFEQMKAPMVAQIPGATLVKSELTPFKGKQSLYMEMNIADPAGKPKKSFLYLFFTGATVYTVTYTSTLPDATVANGKSFFDSVVITD